MSLLLDALENYLLQFSNDLEISQLSPTKEQPFHMKYIQWTANVATVFFTITILHPCRFFKYENWSSSYKKVESISLSLKSELDLWLSWANRSWEEQPSESSELKDTLHICIMALNPCSLATWIIPHSLGVRWENAGSRNMSPQWDIQEPIRWHVSKVTNWRCKETLRWNMSLQWVISEWTADMAKGSCYMNDLLLTKRSSVSPVYTSNWSSSNLPKSSVKPQNLSAVVSVLFF